MLHRKSRQLARTPAKTLATCKDRTHLMIRKDHNAIAGGRHGKETAAANSGLATADERGAKLRPRLKRSTAQPPEPSNALPTFTALPSGRQLERIVRLAL